MTQVAIVSPSKKRKDFNDPMNDTDPEKPNKRARKQDAKVKAAEDARKPPADPATGMAPRNSDGTAKLYAVPDQVADDIVYYRNEHVKALAEAFPADKDMMYVDRFYPNAKGGPLYIDSPATRLEEKNCLEKAHVMLKAKLRYAFVLPGDFLEDVLKRMEDGLADVSPDRAS